MYIASTINPLTKSSEDIPVLLLCYKQTRRFIARPKHYADLVRVASEKLALDPGIVLSFQISTLDICRGHSVEVDESAYQAMCTALDELTVVTEVVEHGTEHEQGGRDTQKGKTPQAPSTPPSSKHDEDRKGKNLPRVEITREEEEEENNGPSAAVLEVKNVRVVEKRERAGESSLTKALDLVANEVEVKEEVVEEEEPEMEQEEEEVPDYWQTLATAPGSGSVKNKERQTTPLEDDEFDSPPLDMTPRHITSGRKSISITVSTRLPTPGPSNNGVESSSRSVVVKPDPEARFHVIISGPGPDQEAEFKTRGKHFVKKVLAGACKTFRLDLARAHLIVPKIVNGEVEYYECPLDQTMAKCGVESGKRFFIHMDEEVDELQDE